MAKGSVHAGDSLMIAAVGGVYLYQRGVPLPSCLVFGLGSAIGGVLLSPDLDQDGLTMAETVVLRRSKILGWSWFMYWFPYAKAIKHRHWSSHLPIIGTGIRLLYLAPLWWLLFIRLGLQVPQVALWGVIGLGVSDIMHFLRDGLLLKRKRRRKRRGKNDRKRYRWTSFLPGSRWTESQVHGSPMGDI